MITVLEYLVIAAAIGAVVFVVAVFVFGRGERMAPLPAQTSPAELPDRGITAQDVYDVKLAMALRGYRMSDVDWVLERLAFRIEELTRQVAELQGADDPVDLVVVPVGGGAFADDEISAFEHRAVGVAPAAGPSIPTGGFDTCPEVSADLEAGEAISDALAYGDPTGQAPSGPADSGSSDIAPQNAQNAPNAPGARHRTPPESETS